MWITFFLGVEKNIYIKDNHLVVRNLYYYKIVNKIL